MHGLIVAQDPDDTAIFALVFQRSGLAVTTAKTVEAGLKPWLERPADLILVSLPDHDPRKIVSQVRAVTPVALILVVPNLDEPLHIDLLKAGADWVIKPPISSKLLIAQITSLLRRIAGAPMYTLPKLSEAGLTLDPTNRTVTVDGNPSQRLTYLEFQLLYTLMTNRGQVIPTNTIVERVWGYSGQGDRDLVRGLVRRLRNKIETPANKQRYITTVSGIGYAFDPKTEDAPISRDCTQ